MALLPAVFSCERVTFPQEDPEGGEEGVTVVVSDPDRTGDGTVGAPATVTDLKLREQDFLGRTCWVTGYIVGYVERTLKNAAFTADGAVQSNVLLASEPGVEDVDDCVPVELKTEKWKKMLSLAYMPENLGRRVAVHGTVNTYFGVAGVRSVNSVSWVKDVEEEPQDPVEEPTKPDTGNPQPEEEPEKHPEEKPDPKPEEQPEANEELLYINKVVLQRVDRPAALRVGERYMIGSLPGEQSMHFVASSLQYGTGQAYRKVIEARKVEDHFVTEQEQAPAVFLLEVSDGAYRFRDELTGAFLAYDVRGDASSTSWLALYTLPEEELDARYNAGFQIFPQDETEQIRTAEPIKYSAVNICTCLLRYNSGGNNFKLNYQKSGFAACLYLLK